MKIFFSQKSQEILKNINYPPENAFQILGRIENNFLRIDSIVPFNMVSQSENSCSIIYSRKDSHKNLIGILHIHPPENHFLPSDQDIETMKKLFIQQEAVLLIAEKKSGSWLIHPYLFKNKLTMFGCVCV